MTMKPWPMMAAGAVLAGTVLAGAALAGCSGTATGSQTASPSGHAAGSATSAQTPAASGTSATAPASTAAPSVAVATCTTSDLRVSVDGSASESIGGSADGSVSHGAGTELVLTNSSRHSCALDGYPALGLLDSRHQVLHTVTHRGSTFFANDPGRRPVDLAPGQTARAGLAWTQNDSSAVGASYLEVTPPNCTTYLIISFRKLVDGGDLDVTALGRTVSLRLSGFGS